MQGKQSKTEVSEKDIEEIEEIQHIQKLMDAENEAAALSSIPSFSRLPSPYLGGDHCLLCQCKRPTSAKNCADENKESAGNHQHISVINCCSWNKYYWLMGIAYVNGDVWLCN